MENSLELEVKILNYDLEKLKNDLLSKGGKYLNTEKQTNIYFNTEDEFLTDYEQLRIRITEFKDKKTHKELTFKKRLEDSTLRRNIELNTSIDDEKNLIETLSYLGYEEIKRACKIRETYDFKGQRIEFDKWDIDIFPYPYCEIEVDSEDKLKEILQELQIPEDKVSTKSIKELVDEL